MVWQSRAARSLAAAVPAEEAAGMSSGDSILRSTRPVVGSLLPSTTEGFITSFPSAMSVPGLAFSAIAPPFGAGIGSSVSGCTSYGFAGAASYGFASIDSSQALAAAAENGGDVRLPSGIASSCGRGEHKGSKDNGKTKTAS